jgi:hypothetical protein
VILCSRISSLARLDARQAASEEHKLHFLRQLKFLLVPDRDEGGGGGDGGHEDRRDDDDDGCGCGDTASIHRTYRTRALENSIDYQLMWQFSLELQQHRKPNPQILTTAVECVVCLWRHASQERRQTAFAHLVMYTPCLVRALQIFPDHDPLFASTIQIFRLWARSTKDQVLVGRLVQSPGFVDFLRQVLSMVPSVQSRVAPVLGLIKDLSFRSSDRDNQLVHAKLADVLSKRIHDSLDAPANGEMTEAGLAVIWKLSTQLSISRSMADDAMTWAMLQRVAQQDFDPMSLVMQRHAASIVGCIMSTVSEEPLRNAGDGSSATPILRQRHVAREQADWILRHVFRVFRSEERDADLRRRWMRLLRCWASSEWGRAILFRRQHAPGAEDGESSSEDMLTLLVHVLRNPDESADVRCQACQAVANILPTVVAKDKGSFGGIFGPCLESILIDAIRDDRTPTKLMIPLCEALNMSIIHNRAWQRGPFNCSASFYERLVSALQEGAADPVLHDRISQLALHLVEMHPTNQQQAVHHVADLAALLVAPVGPEYERSRDNGVSIVDQLVHAQEQDASARVGAKKHLADNERLLSALVGYCLQQHHDGGKKDRAKRLIIELVPEL